MKTSRLSKTAALSIFLTFASFAMNAPAADTPATQASALDMHQSAPALLSAASSYAFYDGSEASSSSVAHSLDMSDFEPVHFSGGNSMAFFDGSEDGRSNTLPTEPRALVVASTTGDAATE